MRKWTQAEEDYIRQHLKFENCVDIGKALNRNAPSVRWKAHQLNLEVPMHIPKHHWNSKHSHLREKVMRYFLTHTIEETRNRFDLTLSEIKSLFTVGYRDESLKHIRKRPQGGRRWLLKEDLFLLKHAGMQPRNWIGKALKRGQGAKNHAIKERFTTLGIPSKFVNGAPLSWVSILFPGASVSFIKTQAGPSSASTDFHLRIIPWVSLELLIDDQTHETVASAVRALAKFQKFIHGTNDPELIARRLYGFSREKEPRFDDACG